MASVIQGTTGMRPIFTASARSVIALMLREMSTRYGRTPGGYLWAIFEPLAMIIVLGMAVSLFARSPDLGTSFLLFKATGTMPLQVFTVLGGQVGHALTFSKPLLRFPRVSWVDAILARFLLNMMVAFTVTVLIIVGIIIVDDVTVMPRWGDILLAMGCAASLGLGVGCLNAYLFTRFAVWQQIWSILTRPLFLFSGVIMTYESLPAFAQQILWYNPLLHISGMMRAGFYVMYQPDYISVPYVGLWIGVPMVLGLLLLRRHHRNLLYR